MHDSVILVPAKINKFTHGNKVLNPTDPGVAAHWITQLTPTKSSGTGKQAVLCLMAGSGSEGVAALLMGRDVVLVDMTVSVGIKARMGMMVSDAQRRNRDFEESDYFSMPEKVELPSRVEQLPCEKCTKPAEKKAADMKQEELAQAYARSAKFRQNGG